MTLNIALQVGDPAPWFIEASSDRQGPYHFDKAAGRYALLFFFGSSMRPEVQESLAVVERHKAMLDQANLLFFGISSDPEDAARLTADPAAPGLHYIYDGAGKVGPLYGFRPEGPPAWLLVDPMLRVIAVFGHQPGVAQGIFELLARIPPAAARVQAEATPVLMLSDVFEPAFCAHLIDHYTRVGGALSGVFTEYDAGQSVRAMDMRFKRRRDCRIEQPELVAQIEQRISRRIVPEIRKIFQFHATYLERILVACYDAAEQGRFGAHRDNTLAAVAHRRFAISINLNDGFSGGGVSFPEFGPRAFSPPTGGAVVFSCGLMHRVETVTAGRRFACLTFAYDEAAAEIRRAHWKDRRGGDGG